MLDMSDLSLKLVTGARSTTVAFFVLAIMYFPLTISRKETQKSKKAIQLRFVGGLVH